MTQITISPSPSPSPLSPSSSPPLSLSLSLSLSPYISIAHCANGIIGISCWGNKTCNLQLNSGKSTQDPNTIHTNIT